MKNILIIGSAGNIGKNLKIALSKKYNLISPKKSKEFNISNLKSLEKYFNEKLDIVINLSGQRESKFKMLNTIVKGNKNIIRLLSKIKKKILVIYISSNLIYGFSEKLLNEKSKTYPLSDYAKFKLRAEKLYKKTDLNYLILRLGNIYGDIQNETNIISNIYRAVKANKKLKIANKDVYRNFISISDLISILTKLISSKLKHKIYNVGYENLKIDHILAYFKKIYKKDIKFVEQKIRKQTLSSQKINCSKLLKELNIRPRNKMYKYLLKYSRNEIKLS